MTYIENIFLCLALPMLLSLLFTSGSPPVSYTHLTLPTTERV